MAYTNLRKGARNKRRIKHVTDDLYYEFTAAWYIFRALRWAGMSWLAQRLYSDKTDGVFVHSKRTGKIIGKFSVMKADDATNPKTDAK